MFFFVLAVLILSNGVAMVIRATENYSSLEEGAKAFIGSWDSVLFVAC